jgi:hypothetical protein
MVDFRAKKGHVGDMPLQIILKLGDTKCRNQTWADSVVCCIFAPASETRHRA